MSESMLTTQEMTQSKKNKWSQVFWLALLVLVMISGGYFRAIGMDWDDHEHLHPDERFLTYVVSSIQPVESVGDYFDTATSTLNPNNVGYAFYVYGTFPVLLTRYVAAQFDITGWDMYIVGRYLSAAFDTLTILLAYLIGYRLFKKDSIGVLAAAFYAYAVLPIQLSHYFAVDIQANFFSMMALWFAVIAMTAPMAKVSDAQPDDDRQLGKLPNWLSGGWTQAAPYLLFGASFGIAMACKISVLPIAALIVLAAFVRYFQLPEDRRVVEFEWLARNVVLAGLVSLLFFRIFQPYAFKGPGFFGIGINDHWLSSLRSLSGQAKGLVDFPPALQWARRPLSFGFSNLVQWGLGLPLGILSVVSFLWMGWKMIRGDWKPYLLLWSFTFVYFAWQSTNFNSMMRYFTQIYLPLGLIAAWGIVELWNTGKRRMARVRWERAVAAVIGLSVFSATLIWAFMFSRIYSRPVTRVEASDWMFQNIPGPINVMLDTAEGERMQIMPFPAGSNVTLADPLLYAFEVKSDSLLMGLKIPHIREEVMEADTTRSLQAVIAEEPEGKNLLGFAQMDAIFNRESGDFGNAYDLSFAEPVELQAGKTYYLILHPGDDQTRMWTVGAISLDLLRMADGVSLRQFLPEVVTALTLEHDYQTSFQAKWNGALTAIELPHVVDLASMPGEKTLLVTIFPASGGDEPQTAVITDDFLPGDDPRGENLSIIFDEPVKIIENEFYTIHFQLNGSGAVGIYGTKQANESSWDDVVPLRRQGYDPFGEITGIYRTDLNFEMYWDDNEDKRERFQNILDQTDLVVITSNRQWGTTTRVPERYPLTSVYYRNLVGCPDDKEIIWCYAVAEPGMFEGNLGFNLVKVFQSDPNLGDFRINDQFAEEAFTVYDHPKVLIFQKTDAYDSDHVRQVLGQVDLSQVIRQLPAEVPMRSSSLLLSDNDFYQQQQGGTWSALFDPGDWFNRFPVLSVVVWYAAITLLGWAAYPIVRVVFGGLSDKGYPLARLTGMMLLAWGTWMLGSNGVEVRPATIWGVFFLILSVSLAIVLYRGKTIWAEIRSNLKHILIVEGIALAFFLAFLLVRVGNPDLWHQYKGGEKPMDFSYLNAVLKSTTFPPYDPWFSGGYINYYYYGFVLVGVPIKALGIVPSVAYNLVLPTLFSLFALGAFAIGYNAVCAAGRSSSTAHTQEAGGLMSNLPYYGGLAAAGISLVMGNLGTIKMINQGLLRIGAPDGFTEGNPFQLLAWWFKGLFAHTSGTPMPYYPGDWYWIPSRAIPGEPITEFPFFTFLYADLHAHLIALPITLLVIAWMLSMLLGKARLAENEKWRWADFAASLFVGALIVGSLRATNTWDLPVYLALSSLTLLYSLLRHLNLDLFRQYPKLPFHLKKGAFVLLSVFIFIGLAFLLYHPFGQWYGQGYNAIKLWDGDHTPVSSYLTHWGIFFAILLSWMVWETREWMASTPLSSLRKLKPYQWPIQIGVIGLVALVVGLLFMGISIIWVALPMAAWAAVLILRKDQPDIKRLVLFMIGSGLFLTIAVELIVLEGDIGRMNTVFKFYLQAWVMLSISSALALIWLFPVVEKAWLLEVKLVWKIVVIGLLLGGACYPVFASADKISDRMAAEAPRGLDGMAYMAYAVYDDQGSVYALDADYHAIRWMQENVSGSPTIIEGNTIEYRWGNRFTIYTGLPGVVGWNWHQRQQRAVTPSEWVTNRVVDVGRFYSTADGAEAKQILDRYGVEYIIVGRLEAANYPAEGLAKFTAFDGTLWTGVYMDTDTTIYKVLE